MTGEWPVWFASGVVLSCLVACLFAYPLGNRRTVAGLSASALVWVALLTTALVTGEVRSGAAAVLFTIAGTAASLPAAAVFAALERPVLPTALAAAGWTALALVPPAVLLFGNGSIWILETVGVLDYAGALVIAVPAFGVVLALRLVRIRRTTPPQPSTRHPLVAAVLVWTCVLAWLAGSELTLSAATADILLAGVVTPVLSAVGWAVVERIRLATNTVAAAGSGAIAGLVAVLAAAPYVDFLWSAVLGAIVGPVTALIAFGGSAGPAWRGGLRHLIAILPAAGAAGIVFLGLFAAERGLVYTGKADVLLTQVAALLLITGWAALVGVLVSVPLRSRKPLARHRGAVAAGSESSARS
jgi:ammonia channel protein AmtB